MRDPTAARTLMRRAAELAGEDDLVLLHYRTIVDYLMGDEAAAISSERKSQTILQGRPDTREAEVIRRDLESWFSKWRPRAKA